MKFGHCIKTVSDIEAVKAAGYDFFEFAAFAVASMTDEEFDRLCLRSSECALPCLSFNSFSSGTPRIVGPGFSAAAVEAYAERLCRRGARLGIRSIGIGSPKARNLPTDFSPGEADGQLAQFLRIVTDCAAPYGISILLEALQGQMCNYINTTAQAVEIVRRSGINNLGIVLDFYHAFCMGEDLSVVPLAAPLLRHTHISTRGEGLSRGVPQMEELALYRDILRALKAVGYDGTLSVEPDSFDDKTAAAGLAMLRAADR